MNNEFVEYLISFNFEHGEFPLPQLDGAQVFCTSCEIRKRAGYREIRAVALGLKTNAPELLEKWLEDMYHQDKIICWDYR